MIDDPAFYAVAVPAVIIVGLAKGGFAGLVIIGMSLMSLVVSPVRAAALMLPILILQDVVSLWAFRRDLDRAVLIVMVQGALIGTILATFTAAMVSDAAVRLVVGVIATAFALDHFAGLARRLTEAAPPPSRIRKWFWGAVSGFTSFVAHAGGPPFLIGVLPHRLGRDALAGTTAWYFAIVNLMKVPSYHWLGQLEPENLWTSAALAPVAVASTVLGVWLVRRTPVARFYRLIYGLMLVVGLKLVYDGITGFYG